MKHLTIITIFTSLFLFVGSTTAEELSYLESIEGLDPMDLSEVDPKVAGILRKYYRFTFGDSLSWEAVESLRIEGEVELKEGTLGFVAYKKKPNYMKVVLYLDNGGRATYAYDGEDAWQLKTLDPDGVAIDMLEGDALNFIRDAAVGGHMIYPQLKGKQFEFMGTASIEGDRVFELKTILPDGQVIRSFLDMTSFAELYVITTNNINQNEELSLYTDFRKINGMRIPYSTTLKVDGETVYRTNITDLRVNSGVMPWVFSRSHDSSAKGSTGSSGAAVDRLPLEPAPGSSFSIQETDIWSTTSGVVGTAFQVESAGSVEGQRRVDVDGLKQEPEEAKASEE